MKKIYIITMVLVLLIGVVLSIVLYGNSPYNRAKNSNDYDEDGNRNDASRVSENSDGVSSRKETSRNADEDEINNAVSEPRENIISYEEDENSSAVSKESDNSDGVSSRKEVSGDAVQPKNDISSNSGEDDDSCNQDNCTYDSNKYGTDDNDNSKEHQVEYDIELEIEQYAREIRVSSGTETVHFRAETLIETEEILLVDANTGSIVATMVDDGQYPISGDDLMNDNVFSCKVEIDISKEKIYEFYAVINDADNDTIISNTVKIEVYAGFTEKELFDREEVFTALKNWKNSDEFKSMELDGKVEATYELLVELSENGTADAPYSLIKKESIHFDKDNYTYTFIFHSGDIGGTYLVEYNELQGH